MQSLDMLAILIYRNKRKKHSCNKLMNTHILFQNINYLSLQISKIEKLFYFYFDNNLACKAKLKTKKLVCNLH